MFQKLLKHEFAVNRGLFTILSLSMLGAGAIGGVVVQILIKLFQKLDAYTVEAEISLTIIGFVVLMMFAFVLFMAIAGCVTGVTIMLFYRFYKRHFTDEGYLTFTLPATTHQILLSSIVNILIWMLIISLVMIAAYVMMFLPLILLENNQFGLWFFENMQYAMAEMLGDGYVAIQVVVSVCSVIASLILPMLSITIGAQAAKKHKLLAGVGIYYGISTAVSVISSIVSFVTTLGDAAIIDAGGTMILSFLFPSILSLGVGIGGYFLMHHLVKNRLNLP